MFEKHRLRINDKISAGLDIKVDGGEIVIEVYLEMDGEEVVIKRTFLINKSN